MSNRRVPLSARHDRIVAHFDLDAFYVGCERELNPTALLGVPVAVSQYNPYGNLEEKSASEFDRRLVVCPGSGRGINADTNGSLIAVSYEARAASVKRNDRGHEAVRKCPELRIVQVPVKRGKADLTMYRDASLRVMRELVSSIKSGASEAAASKMCVEKASIDEIYIDLSSIAYEMARKVIEERNSLRARQREEKISSLSLDVKTNLWREIIHSSGVSTCTTIGGVEDMSDHALAANGLSKDELRRGSHFQVLDSSSKPGDVEEGSKAWWNRNLIEWTDMEVSLACGAAIASRARSDVASFFSVKTDAVESSVFTLSAGISSNKTLAKLASGLKKPNRQTLINPTDDEALQKLFHPLPVGRIRGLGGKFGCEVSTKLDVSTIGDLARLPIADIEKEFPPSPENDTAQFLFNISRGICTEDVSDRTAAKSIACGKTFRGQLALDPSKDEVLRRWAGELCSELTERLSEDRRENHRSPKLLVVSVKMSDKSKSVSRSAQAPRIYDLYTDEAMRLIRQIVGNPSDSKITGLTVFASSFIDVADESTSILAAFDRSARGAPQRQGNRAESEGCSHKGSKQSTKQLTRRRKVSSLETFWSQARAEGSLESSGAGRENIETKEAISSCASNGIHGDSSSLFQSKQTSTSDMSSETSSQHMGGGNYDVSAIGESDEGVPDFLSHLPLSIRSELRLSSISGRDGNRRESKQGKGMERWLTQKKETSQNVKSRTAAKKDLCAKEKAKLNRFFDASKVRDDKAAKQFSQPTFDEVDQETLLELPADIRSAILKDMDFAKKQGKRKRIDAFFPSTKSRYRY